MTIKDSGRLNSRISLGEGGGESFSVGGSSITYTLRNVNVGIFAHKGPLLNVIHVVISMIW
jgi:hypothetical protein